MDGRTLHGRIQQAAGGVGRNIADALAKISSKPTKLISAVGNDLYGQFILNEMKHVETSGVSILPRVRTACYNQIIDKEGEASFGISDMEVHSFIKGGMIKKYKKLFENSPIIVIDGNMPLETIDYILQEFGGNGVPVWFEPTNITEADKPLKKRSWKNLSFISPNLNELREMVKTLGLSVRERGTLSVEFDKTVEEIKCMTQPLSEHIPIIMVTLGKHGIMMVSKLPADEPLKEALSRPLGRPKMRYYPVEPISSLVNVSGAGDCAAAGFICGFIQGLTEPECIHLANLAAKDSLRSLSAVPEAFSKMDNAREEFKTVH